MKVYISGKISGLEINHAKSLFEKASVHLSESGYTPINPMRDGWLNEGESWQNYMLQDIQLLFGCDAIYMLYNWKDSKGARIEHTIACEMGFKIMYQ